VQLYFRDRYASMARPAAELADFRRVGLRAGEKRSLTFEINPNKFAFLDGNMRWKAEAGEFDILIGASSEDIRLSGVYTLDADLFIDGRDRV